MKPALRDWLIGGLLLLGLVVWVQLEVGWARLLAPWREVSLLQLGYLLALSLGSYLCRGVRLYVYFPELLRGRLGTALRLSVLHNFANNLLPMRAGEAAFPLLMKRYFGHGYMASTLSLIWIRLLDLLVIALVALGAAWLAQPNWVWPALAALLLAGLPISYALRQRLTRWLEGRTGRLPGLLRQVLLAMPANGTRLLHVLLWTVLSWASKFVAFTVILRHFLEAELWQAWVGIVGAELSSVLPFHGVAGAGSYELAMVAAIVPTGISAEAALQGAVNLHLFLLGVTLLLGPLALLLPRDRRPLAAGN
jgi:hypothetical protein